MALTQKEINTEIIDRISKLEQEIDDLKKWVLAIDERTENCK